MGQNLLPDVGGGGIRGGEEDGKVFYACSEREQASERGQFVPNRWLPEDVASPGAGTAIESVLGILQP